MEVIFDLPPFLLGGALTPNQAWSVNTRSPESWRMVPEWQLSASLLDGTARMRAQAQTYLPKRTLEEKSDYDNRLATATLFPAYSETVSTMTGRVFAKPVIVKTSGDDIVPQWIQDEVLPDVDMQGNNIHVFCHDWFRQGMAYGHSPVLVESPKTDGVKSIADQKAANIRPYAIRLAPWRILGWRLDPSGELQQVRIIFFREEAFGDFGVKLFWQIRVYEINDQGKVEILTYETADGVDWAPLNNGMPVVTDLPRIPLVVFYTKRRGVLTSELPLRELAYLNVKHWQQQSGYDSLIDVASVPILCATGIDDSSSEILIGAKHSIKLPIGAEMKYVEHTGKALEAGRVSLDSLKDEMQQSGARLLRPPRETARTATQAAEDQSRENSTLGAMVGDFEDACEELLDLFAMYRGQDEGGQIEAQPNLEPDPTPATTMVTLLAMRNASALSTQTLFSEGQRRGLIAEDIAWEDEQARIDAEGPIAPPIPQPGAQGAQP